MWLLLLEELTGEKQHAIVSFESKFVSCHESEDPEGWVCLDLQQHFSDQGK